MTLDELITHTVQLAIKSHKDIQDIEKKLNVLAKDIKREKKALKKQAKK
jgi:hypothetical protein